MTTSSRSEEVARRTTTPSWRREAIELAALFVAVAVADMFANSLAHQPAGSIVLTGMGGLLIVCAVAHHWWRHRAEPTQPATEPVAAKTTGVWRVRATVRDTPGSLAALAASLAGHGMNIVSVQVHAVPDDAVDEFLLETRASATAQKITAAVEAGGGQDVSAEPADLHDLVDVPTRVLTSMTQLVANRLELDEALRTLLGDCDITRQRGHPGTEGPAGTVLRLAAPPSGALILRRPSVPFTPAEFARARALLDLNAQLAERAEHTAFLLPDGTELSVRRAEAADVPGIAAMHSRCSDRSRRQRYLVGTTGPAIPELQRLVSRRNGHTLVAERSNGEIVAMANLVWNEGTAELAVLVEDAWQRRSIGTALLRRLTGIARTVDLDSCYAIIEMSNRPMITTLRRLGAETERIESGLAHMAIHPKPPGGQPVS
jgi:GNAT superfamily N-acetyltransferase